MSQTRQRATNERDVEWLGNTGLSPSRGWAHGSNTGQNRPTSLLLRPVLTAQAVLGLARGLVVLGVAERPVRGLEDHPTDEHTHHAVGRRGGEVRAVAAVVEDHEGPEKDPGLMIKQ